MQLPHQPPIAGTVYDCQSNQPVHCTGAGRRVGGRSVSDRRPDAPTAASCPRWVRPVPAAAPRATFPHHALSGTFDFFYE